MKKYVILACICLFLSSCSGSEAEKSVRFLQKGQTLFEQGDYTKAALEFRNALQVDGANVDAYLRLAETYLKLEDLKNAFASYSRAVALDPQNKKAKLKLASFYFLMKKFDEVRQNIDPVLKEDPLNTEALMLKAGLYLQENDVEEAEFVLKRVIRNDETQVRPYLTLSRLQLNKGEFKEAETLLTSAINKVPDSDALQLKLALFKLFDRTKQHEAAENYLNELVTDQPDDTLLQFELAQLRFRQNKPDQTEEVLKRILKKEPQNKRAIKMLAVLYESTERVDEALSIYQAAHEKAPEDHALTLELARRSNKYGKNEDAAKYIDEILQKQPEHKQARLLEAEHLILNKKFEVAQQKLDQLLIDVPGSFAEANYQKALAYIGSGDTEAAKELLMQVIERRPDHFSSVKLLGKVYLSQRQYQNALDLGEKALVGLPENVEALEMVGASAILLNRIEKARITFDKLAEVKPQDPKAYQALGLIHSKLKDHPKALASFGKVLELVPGRLDTIQKMILIHMADGKPELAHELCDRWLNDGQRTPQQLTAALKVLKGQVYLSQKELDNAEKSFEEAIELSPDLQESYFMLAMLSIRRYGEEKAIEEMQKKIAANPEQPAPHLLIANMYDLNKQHDKSENHYRKVLELRTGFLPAINNLAYVLVEQEKNLEEALSLAQQALEKMPGNLQVLDTLGWVQTKLGQHDEGIANLLKSLEQAPDHPSILYHLGVAYMGKGENDMARQELKRALSSGQDFPEKAATEIALAKL